MAIYTGDGRKLVQFDHGKLPDGVHVEYGKRCFFCYIPNPNGETWWFANLGRKTPPSKQEIATTNWRAELLDLVRDDKM